MKNFRAILPVGCFTLSVLSGCSHVSHDYFATGPTGGTPRYATAQPAPPTSLPQAMPVQKLLPEAVAVRPTDAAAPEAGAIEEQEASGQSPDGVSPGQKDDSQSKLSHAPDFHWLIGELWYSTSQKAYRIHFSPQRHDDPYGGVLTLGEPGPMTNYSIGQVVYVEGQVVGTGDKAVYNVHRILEMAQQEGASQEGR
jgi:hypothetical protein